MDKTPSPLPARKMFAQEPLGVRLRAWRPNGLQIALLVSLAFHGLVLVALAIFFFADPTDFSRVFQDTPLEIVLVNARSQEAPEKAQVIAQAQLAGGGEADLGRATSPLPPSPSTETGDSETTTRKQMEELAQEQQQLLLQARRELSTMPMPDPRKPATTPQEKAEEEHYKQALRTLAEIEKVINEQNSRPRRRYLSPASREEVYAVFMDNLRHRIEERGTQSYPTMNGKPLFGALVVNIAVNARGEVLDVKVMRSSGSHALDQRAVEIAEHAGPFGEFTPEMRKQADELEFTWRFDFTNASGLVATPMSNERP